MNKRAQVMVEFLMLIVILIPILLMVTKTIKEKFTDKFDKWIEKEVQCQVRYGYSAKDLTNVNQGSLANTSGNMPLNYQQGQQSDHPIAYVIPGD
jgi:hypothetical protein